MKTQLQKLSKLKQGEKMKSGKQMNKASVNCAVTNINLSNVCGLEFQKEKKKRKQKRYLRNNAGKLFKLKTTST